MIAEFMLNHFDKDNDGHSSPNEQRNTQYDRTPRQVAVDGSAKSRSCCCRTVPAKGKVSVESFFSWCSREWPLMDWKIGVFIWQTFGGILLVIAVLCIMPGRLHTWSGKVLRWPILAVAWLLINVKFIVYCAIQLTRHTGH